MPIIGAGRAVAQTDSSISSERQLFFCVTIHGVAVIRNIIKSRYLDK